MNNNKQPQPWPPYSQDCSQGYCSYYCPQYCFFLFPPPPPPSPSAHLLLSPILIAVIALVSTFFLLIAYYILLTAYRRRRHPFPSPPTPQNPTAATAPTWHPPSTGLDDTLIEKIAAYRYQSGTGLLVDGTDCSVCLSSFEDGDRIRLLPKCSHAFHVPCIDTWLKSHSNCPLCRAGVQPSLINSATSGHQQQIDNADDRTSAVEIVVQDPSDVEIEIDVDQGMGQRLVGRSLSMDSELRGCEMVSPVQLNRAWSMRCSSSSGSGRGRSTEVLPT